MRQAASNQEPPKIIYPWRKRESLQEDLALTERTLAKMNYNKLRNHDKKVYKKEHKPFKSSGHIKFI